MREQHQKLDQNKLSEHFYDPKIKWNFIPPASPHIGGSWERLVRSIKKTLYAIMPTRNPSDELLLSILTEVENIVNTRPLTHIPIESAEDSALTPNHFLLGSSSGAKAIGDFNDDGRVLRRNWMTSQRYANIFWKKWIAEYLPSLTRRTKWFEPVPPITAGDVVIIIDETQPRGNWPKGRILETIISKDGQTRKAIVQTSTGIYERPTVKLAVLDVHQKESGSQS